MRLTYAFLSAALMAGAAFVPASAAAAEQGARSFRGTLAQCPNGHRVRLEAGRRYTVSASSSEFDTVLSVYRHGEDAVLAQDDDGGEANNSRLTFAPSETGSYLLCVAAFGTGGSGAYDVEVEEAGPLPPAVTEPTRTETVTRRIYEGSLAEGDARDGDAWYDDYQIELRAGQRMLVSVDSEAFDSLLKVYRADQRGGEPVATDDDSGGALNAMLALAPAEAGTFIVRVTSFSGGSGGDYELRIDE